MTEIEVWKHFAGQAMTGFLAGRSTLVSANNLVAKSSEYADAMTKEFKDKYREITGEALPKK
jgi:hypothetical protein